jgi:hypothetical protein
MKPVTVMPITRQKILDGERWGCVLTDGVRTQIGGQSADALLPILFAYALIGLTLQIFRLRLRYLAEFIEGKRRHTFTARHKGHPLRS